jgi:hypothetical protein
MLNYEVDRRVLAPFVPAGTELDQWKGRTLLSVVGFLFLETKLRGLSIPFHRNFEEVNLRFYVRRRAPEGWRRGVVFVRELVPRAVVAWAARLLYNERYVAAPMGHRVEEKPRPSVSYWWRLGGKRGELSLAASGEPVLLQDDTEEEFIAEHYWGYARQRNGRTLEYRVEHPRWRIWLASQADLRCDVASTFGPVFAEPLSAAPVSAFLAEGSAVCVYAGRELER